MILLEKILAWVEKNLPALIAAFSIGYRKGSEGKQDVERKLLDTEVELEKERNRRAIEEANKGFDDRSIIRAATDKGRNILRRK